MTEAQRYLSGARNRASNFHNFVDDPRHMRFVNQPNLMADGSGAAAAPAAAASAGAGSTASVKKSQPYGVTVSSASGSAVQNFDVLGAYQYINNPGFSADGATLTIGNLSITSAIPGVTYRELLYQTQNNPFTIGQTYLSCPTLTAQVLQVFTIQTKDANGTNVTIPIVPVVDPYQFQAGNNVVEQEYRIDGYTKLTFANILPAAVLTIFFYPSDNINPARALGGQAVGKQFANPGTIRKNS